jgi:hypothetical protein
MRLFLPKIRNPEQQSVEEFPEIVVKKEFRIENGE